MVSLIVRCCWVHCWCLHGWSHSWGLHLRLWLTIWLVLIALVLGVSKVGSILSLSRGLRIALVAGSPLGMVPRMDRWHRPVLWWSGWRSPIELHVW